jgi:hypothetical protein
MDGSQFDAISRRFAGRSTRRDAVRSGGIMAAVAGVFGVRSIARAQDDEDVTECEWAFTALITGGPNEGDTFEGTLNVEIERDGAIDRAMLETEDDEFKVVGNTRGKAISLRIVVSSSEALACTGVGSRDIKSCAGTISGTLAGPEFGDIGVWEIVRRVVPGGESTATAAATGTAGQPTPTVPAGQPTQPAQPTSTPCPPQTCGGAKVWDPGQCKCVCYEGGVDCGGDACCPETMICVSGGGCDCPPGKINCNAACHDACPPGQTFDTNTCTCVQSNCPSGQKECGGVCIDVVNDENNCGACGSVCPSGMPCIAGTCKCPATMKYCATKLMCIDENAVC